MPALYVHVPFCEKKCVYCDFYSIETETRYDDFVALLVREIELRAAWERQQHPGATDDAAAHIGAARQDTPSAPHCTSIFFGGGTPSLLSPQQLGSILAALRSHFPVTHDAEITVECNPGTVTNDKLAGYRALGVNRLSFGVQSFHDDDLRFLSRIHTAREAEDGIALAHAAGFENVNLDLMFSLPGQTPERWMYNLERARALGTTHLSCYSLTVERGTPLAGMVDRGEVRVTGEESDALLFEITMDTLGAWDFKHYEVSNYALPGYECLHNLAYWRHDQYYGFGPSAHGALRDRREWNARSLAAWSEALRRGTLPVAGGEHLDASILRSEYVYLRLRSEGIDLAEFHTRFGCDFLADNSPAAQRLLDEGLLQIIDGRISLTRKGFLVCDEISASVG